MKRRHIILLAVLGGLVLAIAGVVRMPADSPQTKGATVVPDCGQSAGCTPGDPASWAPSVAADIGTIFSRAPR